MGTVGIDDEESVWGACMRSQGFCLEIRAEGRWVGGDALEWRVVSKGAERVRCKEGAEGDGER